MNDQNLNRGKQPPKYKPGLIPQPHGGALAPPGTGGGGSQERLMKGHAEYERVKKAVAADGDNALEEIHKSLTSLTVKIVKKAERSGKVPDRGTMDVIKEFRQTQEAVNEARRARGAVAQAEEFFATMDTRLAEAQARMANGPAPPVELPA